ncbi:hypothetical protein IKG50_02880 [Candidatus Saccharibacteria bacterium]|nr:hypothetical protein [Candidatus Saccharibacteria bacterium]
MLLFGTGLFSNIFGIVENFLPFIIIILIVSLIDRYSKGKKTDYGYVKPGEALMADVPENKPDNSGAMNALLYIGSFLIVGSMFLFIRDEPRLMPVILMIVTLLTFTAGSLLFRFVKFLRPVGLAFTYTAMVLFPTWFYAFREFGLGEEVSMLLTSLFSMLAYAVSAVVVNSKVAGWLSYIFLILFGWSFAASIDTVTYDSKLINYAFFIWPCIVAILPNIFWSFRVKWLPVPFRSATKTIAEVLTPVFVSIAVLSLFSADMDKYPMLRTITASIAIVNGLISWFATKKRGALVTLRFYIQALIIFIVADATGYSIISGITSENTAISLSIAIVWLVSFLFQVICSLFIPQRNEEEKKLERAILVTSLVGIFAAALFCLNFEMAARAISLIAVASVVTMLSILIAIRYRNANWLIATVFAISFIPFQISQLASISLDNWVFFIIYTAITLVFIIVYAILKLMQADKKGGINFAITAVIVSGSVCLAVTGALRHPEASLLAAAIELALIGLISGKRALFEASTYIAACSISALIGSLTRISYYSDTSTSLAISAIQTNIIALPILCFGFFKEYRTKNKARTIIGYIFLALVMFTIASVSNYEKIYIWPLIFILEEVILLVVGILLKYQWMSIASAILVVITTLELTGGFSSSIWLLLIGVALIGFVAWQLARNAKKQ